VMRCNYCLTVPDDLWRWCPDCGGRLSVDWEGLVGRLESFCVDWATPAEARLMTRSYRIRWSEAGMPERREPVLDGRR
jgi:hypothetical protein